MNRRNWPHVRQPDGRVCKIFARGNNGGAPWSGRWYSVLCGDDALRVKAGNRPETTEDLTCIACIAERSTRYREIDWRYINDGEGQGVVDPAARRSRSRGAALRRRR